MQSTVVCKSLYCIDIKRPFRTGSVVFVTHKEFLRNHLMLEVKTFRKLVCSYCQVDLSASDPRFPSFVLL